jgi:hypothetical protein
MGRLLKLVGLILLVSVPLAVMLLGQPISSKTNNTLKCYNKTQERVAC